MGKRLVIAEKPSVAQTVAKALGVTEKSDGYLESNEYIVTWCFGHMLTIEDDPSKKRWTMEDLPIIPEEFRYVPIQDSRKQLNLISNLMRRSDVSSIVCATDAGREGELIFRLVYNWCEKETGKHKDAERLWVSSLEEDSIRKGFQELKPSSEYDKLYASALARNQADWLVGINATRFYSLAFDSPDGKPMTVGRVQTPTLEMIVERHREATEFVSVQSFMVQRDFGGWTLSTKKMETEEEAKKVLSDTEGKPSVIMKIKETDRKEAPPLLYSLTALQMDTNRTYGYSADDTLKIAQKLYERKMLSYPRTDAEYLTSDMEEPFRQIVKPLSELIYPELEFVGTKRIIDDSKVTDHYALILTRHCIRTMQKDGMAVFSNGETNVIRLVAKRMLQAVSPWHEWHETKVTAETEGIEFTGTGRKEKKAGFTAIGKKKQQDTGEKKKEQNLLPDDIAEGKSYMPMSEEVKTINSQPPKEYTEETLLAAMEKAGNKDMPEDAERRGLGTSATRASIIENLVSHGYVIKQKRAKGAPLLIPTDKAQYLMNIVSPGLKDVKMTADWECRLMMIQKGKDTGPAFMNDIEMSVRNLIEEGLKNAGGDVGKKKGKGEYIGICPSCGSPVMLFPKYAACQNRECGARLWRESGITKERPLTNDEMRQLFRGKTVAKKLHSAKKNKDYCGYISLSDDIGTYTGKDGNVRKNYNLMLSFTKPKELGNEDGSKC